MRAMVFVQFSHDERVEMTGSLRHGARVLMDQEITDH